MSDALHATGLGHLTNFHTRCGDSPAASDKEIQLKISPPDLLPIRSDARAPAAAELQPPSPISLNLSHVAAA